MDKLASGNRVFYATTTTTTTKTTTTTTTTPGLQQNLYPARRIHNHRGPTPTGLKQPWVNYLRSIVNDLRLVQY